MQTGIDIAGAPQGAVATHPPGCGSQRQHVYIRPQGRHKRNQPNAGFILFWPLSGLVIYSGGFLARGVAWVFIHLFTTGQQASTQGRAVGSEFSEFA